MTKLTHAESAKELTFRPATAEGWAWTWQRCGRYDYRKRLTNFTNPDHLIPRGPAPTNIPSLRVGARYATERPIRTALSDAGSTEDADD
ncbi:hypothetical protein BN000_05549 [Mycobacterium europaeum]|uniref:Uncharacterized protein n=1 Tax=Mycobacterium europaeum TaxID=761804 RepID=A0A0U1DT48_9MYCO|nr:hypothetical protein [Mycobacterium europaeum]CQD22262.1 hypothetical protein BN000_05549 [Mycobacterium europaeum]